MIEIECEETLDFIHITNSIINNYETNALEDIIGNTFNSGLQTWGNEPITNDRNDYGLTMEFSDITTFPITNDCNDYGLTMEFSDTMTFPITNDSKDYGLTMDTVPDYTEES